MPRDPRSVPSPGQHVFSAAQIDYLGLPPRPLIPAQRIVNPDGTAVFEYHRFLTQQYEWERRLLSILTGVAYPAL